MAATQRAAAMPFMSLVGASPLRLLQHRGAALCQSGIQRRRLSGQPAARLGLGLGLNATARPRPLALALHRHTPAPLTLTAILPHSVKRRYSGNQELPTYFPPQPPPPPPPKSSFAGRLLRLVIRVVGATSALLLGYVIGGYLLLLSLKRAGLRQKKYADEQVQLLKEGKIEEYARFQEPGARPKSAAAVEKTVEILQHILGHPYVREHLEAPASLDRDGWEMEDGTAGADAASARLPADWLFFHMIRFLREKNMMTDVMASEHAMPVPPLTWRDDRGDELVMIAYTGKDLCGHENIVHGGFVATLLDEAMARCCFKTLPGNVGVTAYLHIDYRAPTPANGYVVVKAKTTQVEGRKAWVEARLETLPPANSSEAPRVLAEAKAMFVAPKEFTFVDKWLKAFGLYNNVGL